MAGIKLPTPSQNIYRERGPLGGLINSTVDAAGGRASAGESIASGLASLAGGLGAWAEVLERREYQEKAREAMRPIEAFQERERAALARTNETKGHKGGKP